MRMDEEYVGERVMRMDVERGEGKEDLREKGLSWEETQNRLHGGNVSETSTAHRRRKRLGGRRSERRIS